MITAIEDYFSLGCGRCERFATADCSARRWQHGVLALRTVCLELKLTETVKWGHPCYMHQDRNIALIGALRDDFRLSFFNAALLKDPARVLEKQGPNTPYPDVIKFTDAAQVDAMKDTLQAYLKEAMAYAEAGLKPPKIQQELVLPDTLLEALEADPVLAEAFYRLTPGRQKSYVINLSTAKKEATRLARIAAFRERILAGKGAQER